MPPCSFGKISHARNGISSLPHKVQGVKVVSTEWPPLERSGANLGPVNKTSQYILIFYHIILLTSPSMPKA